MFLPDLSPLTNQINQFTQQQNFNQQQIISLLKQNNLALAQIQQTLQESNLLLLKSFDKDLEIKNK